MSRVDQADRIQYIPAQKELVLGTVIARHSEGFRVDLGSSQMASLDALAFEGATKRSKPNLKVCILSIHLYRSTDIEMQAKFYRSGCSYTPVCH